MTTSAIQSGGRQVTWTREKIIERIQRWVAVYGEPPRAADWNPSSARWAAQTWRIERYEKGDPETGEPWPSLNAAKKPFGGSLNAAVIAAGFEPARTGPPAKRATVNLDTDRLEMHPLARAQLREALREVEVLTEKVATRERQLERSRQATLTAREERDAARRARTVTKTKTKVATRVKTKVERVVDERALARVEARYAREIAKLTAKLDQAVASAERAQGQAKEARAHAAKRASRLERAEATISDLRTERREAAAEVKALDRALEAAYAETLEARDEAAALRRAQKVIVKDAPEQAAIDAALREARDARGRAAESDVRAIRFEREYLELAEAATGAPRRLSKAEVEELRAKGPSGPALLGAAIKDMTKARANGGNPVQMRAALTAIASAAVSWRERL